MTTICLADCTPKKVLGFVTGFPGTLQEGKKEGKEAGSNYSAFPFDFGLGKSHFHLLDCNFTFWPTPKIFFFFLFL